MIVYLHPSQRPIVPPWLADWRPAPGSDIALVQRDTEHGHLVGLGDPLIFDCPPVRIFANLDDGWRVAQVGPVAAPMLARLPRWFRSEPVTSMDGEVWRAPVILGADGSRAFLFRLGGRDYLPLLSDEQQRCEAVARAALEAIPAGIDMGPEACHWAAVLLAAANHIPAEAIAALGLLDGQLVAEVLGVATSHAARYQPPAEVES